MDLLTLRTASQRGHALTQQFRISSFKVRRIHRLSINNLRLPTLMCMTLVALQNERVQEGCSGEETRELIPFASMSTIVKKHFVKSWVSNDLGQEACAPHQAVCWILNGNMDAQRLCKLNNLPDNIV